MTTMQKWTVASACLRALAATLTVTAALERSCSGGAAPAKSVTIHALVLRTWRLKSFPGPGKGTLFHAQPLIVADAIWETGFQAIDLAGR